METRLTFQLFCNHDTNCSTETEKLSHGLCVQTHKGEIFVLYSCQKTY